MAIGWVFLYEAYAQLGINIATLVYYSGPVIVVALSLFLFHERITFCKTLSFGIVLTGMYLVNKTLLQHGKVTQGLFFAVLAAFMYAVMVIANKKATSISGLENSMLQLIVSFFTVAVFVLIKHSLSVTAIIANIMPVLFLGVINTGIGCYLYFSSIQQLPVSSVAICGYLEPLSALLFSTVFLQEKLTGIQIIGAIFIIEGAAFGELSFHRQRSHDHVKTVQQAQSLNDYEIKFNE